MQSFIFDVVTEIHSKHESYEDVMVILPSQRSTVFVREAFKNQIDIGFLPEILSIEDFVTKVTGFDKIDQIQLLFQFYEVYQKVQSDAQSFELFSKWASTALQDFNEADQYLVNTKDLFNYVRDIKRLQKWSVQDELEETEMMKSHYAFVEELGNYYRALKTHLISQKKGYQGLIFRQALEAIEPYLSSQSETSFYFVGFNALTKSEELLIQHVLQHAKSDIFWDIDESLLHSNHPSGRFIRTYKETWHYYEKHEFKFVSNNLTQAKDIHVIGATKNVTKIKEVGNLLSSFQNYSNTALVLGDESLLPVLLNSIPTKVPAINITMGYALKDVPAYQMFKAYFELFISKDKLKTEQEAFYFKPLFKFLNNSFFKSLISSQDRELLSALQQKIERENLSFVKAQTLKTYFQESQMGILFQAIKTPDDFLTQILHFIEEVRDRVSKLDREYLFRFYTAFVQIRHLNQKYGHLKDIKILFTFYKQVLSKEALSFRGEPLTGLQCMGVLETRVLDFDQVIITSMNEGVIPKNSQGSSFVPFDVKVHFGLPTYKEKDAVFSYHIFRLLQRAKRIYLFYNTENDVYGAGEKSRFISQLDFMRSDIQHSLVSPRIPVLEASTTEVPKTNDIIAKLKQRAERGFSPSSIGAYLYNPIEFYKQKILGLQEADEVEETMAANTMGSIVHRTLEDLYAPYLNKYLKPSDFDDMASKAVGIIDTIFPNYFYGGNYRTGKNRLIYEIVKNYIHRFIKQERRLVAEGASLKLLALEKQMQASLRLSQFDFPIKIYGEIDRIDELNGKIRIIDYKTGLVTPGQLGVPADWNLNDAKYTKAIQVLMYALLFLDSNEEVVEVSAGNISFKKLSEGFIPISFKAFKENRSIINRDRLARFRESLSQIFEEIFDINTPFVTKEH